MIGGVTGVPGGYSHTIPIRVCAIQWGRDFEVPDLERGIIFRMHESSSFVSSHLKLFKVRLRLKIWFNALTSKLLYSLHDLCLTFAKNTQVPPPPGFKRYFAR